MENINKIVTNIRGFSELNFDKEILTNILQSFLHEFLFSNRFYVPNWIFRGASSKNHAQDSFR